MNLRWGQARCYLFPVMLSEAKHLLLVRPHCPDMRVLSSHTTLNKKSSKNVVEPDIKRIFRGPEEVNI